MSERYIVRLLDLSRHRAAETHRTAEAHCMTETGAFCEEEDERRKCSVRLDDVFLARTRTLAATTLMAPETRSLRPGFEDVRGCSKQSTPGTCWCE